jgi:hypothetical protein
VDFVVVGFGLGALGILLGVILRGWLAGRCERAAARATDPAVTAYERANAAECRGAGQALLAAGSVVALATVGGLAGALNDRTGALLVTTTATVAALGIILWGYLYRSRNPMPPRPRRQNPLATMAGATGAAFALDVAERPAEAPVWAAASGEPRSAPDSVEQPLMAEPGGEPGDAEANSGSPTEETADLVHAEPAPAMDRSAADASPDAATPGAVEAMHPDVGAAANGHLAADEAGADEHKVVAFVARGTGAGMKQSAVSDDDEVDDH